jgi:hypothetical protein
MPRRRPLTVTDMIADTDISVIVQGPVHPQQTTTVLASVRQTLPGAEILLSSWRDSDLAWLDRSLVDRVVLSADPGPNANRSPDGRRLNMNRQILSTAAGLRAATRGHALKLRTDIALTGNGFLTHFGAYAPSPDHRILTERVIALPAYRPRVTPFMVADYCFFGRRADLLTLWDIPAYPPPRALMAGIPDPAATPHDSGDYLWHLLLARHRPIDWTLRRASAAHEALSIASLEANLICLDADLFGVCFLKPGLRFEQQPLARCGFARRVGFAGWLDWHMARGGRPAPAALEATATLRDRGRTLDAILVLRDDRLCVDESRLDALIDGLVTRGDWPALKDWINGLAAAAPALAQRVTDPAWLGRYLARNGRP